MATPIEARLPTMAASDCVDLYAVAAGRGPADKLVGSGAVARADGDPSRCLPLVTSPSSAGLTTMAASEPRGSLPAVSTGYRSRAQARRRWSGRKRESGRLRRALRRWVHRTGRSMSATSAPGPRGALAVASSEALSSSVAQGWREVVEPLAGGFSLRQPSTSPTVWRAKIAGAGRSSRGTLEIEAREVGRGRRRLRSDWPAGRRPRHARAGRARR